MTPKRAIKSFLQAALPSRIPPVIVASIGRSGSTLVYDALCEAMARRRFGRDSGITRRLVSDSAWRLDGRRLHSGVVYKTHALASELPSETDPKVVFLYRRASDVVLSVLAARSHYGDGWIESHLQHLRAAGPVEELVQRDGLRIEEQIDGWLNSSTHRVLGLKYETLWSNSELLEEFVGLPVKLPSKKPGEPLSLPDDVIEAVRRTYRRLDKKIESLPDFLISVPTLGLEVRDNHLD